MPAMALGLVEWRLINTHSLCPHRNQCSVSQKRNEILIIKCSEGRMQQRFTLVSVVREVSIKDT